MSHTLVEPTLETTVRVPTNDRRRIDHRRKRVLFAAVLAALALAVALLGDIEPVTTPAQITSTNPFTVTVAEPTQVTSTNPFTGSVVEPGQVTSTNPFTG